MALRIRTRTKGVLNTLVIATPGQAKRFVGDHFSFFDFLEYEVDGVERVVRPREFQRFLDSGPSAQYLEQEQQLVDWFVESIVACEPMCWLKPATGRWFVVKGNKVPEDTVYKQVKHWLTDYGLRYVFKGAVGTSDPQVIRWLTTATLRGYCDIQVLLPEAQIVALPCDHGDLHLYMALASSLQPFVKAVPPGFVVGDGCGRKNSS